MSTASKPSSKAKRNLPLAQQIRTVRGEFERRRRSYPKLVSRGHMRQSEADHEIDAMRSALNTLEWMEIHREDLIAFVQSRRELSGT